jgi:hypothetical protein
MMDPVKNANAIATILILGVFVRWFSHFWLSDWYSPQAWFYMLGGVLEVVLCGVIYYLISSFPVSLAKTLVRIAMAIGMVQGATTPIGRLLTKDINAVPKDVNLIDYYFGLPANATLIGLSLFAIFFVAGKEAWKQSNQTG